MSVIYFYDQNVKNLCDSERKQQDDLIHRFNNFKNLQYVKTLDQERKFQILEPVFKKFNSQIVEKQEQIDGLENISNYLDELLDEKRKTQTEVNHIKSQIKDVKSQIKKMQTDLGKLVLLVSKDN